MKIKLPSPDTMDKVILGVAIAGIAVIIATVHAIPGPDEFNNRVNHVLTDLKDLNSMTTNAIGRGDYHMACELQRTSVELMLKTYPLVGDDILDLSQSIERDLCAKAKERTI